MTSGGGVDFGTFMKKDLLLRALGLGIFVFVSVRFFFVFERPNVELQETMFGP